MPEKMSGRKRLPYPTGRKLVRQTDHVNIRDKKKRSRMYVRGFARWKNSKEASEGQYRIVGTGQSAALATVTARWALQGERASGNRRTIWRTADSPAWQYLGSRETCASSVLR